VFAGRTTRIELLLIALALAFGWVGAISLALQNAGGAPLAAMGLLSALALIAHLWLNRVAPGRDPLLLPITILLTAFGLLSVARVAPNFQARQLFSLVVAMAALLAIASSRDQLRWLRRFKYTWLIGAFALLLITLLFGVNPTGFGARLWLSVAGLFVQPSELLRLLVIAFLAAYFAERLETRDWELATPAQSLISNPKGTFSLQSLAPALAMWLAALVLLLTQQDLGAASLLLITYVFMLYLATGSARLPVALAGALVAAGALGYFVSDRVAQRLDIWLNPWADPQGNAFQVVQSLIAMASGGVFGQGINQGRPGYVPAVHTDFPFVMVGEEFGLMGALGLIACFAILSLRGWRIALAAAAISNTRQTAYRMLLAGGLAAAIAVQVFVIIGGNLGLLPLTGITLPLVSYGGTSLLVSYIMIALLIRLSADGTDQWAVSRGRWAVERLPVTNYQLPVVRRAAVACGALFAAVALMAGYWGAVSAQGLVARDDNPRRVEAELAIARGPIFDRNGNMLARSDVRSIDNNVPRYGRVYPAIEAAPAIGYYSQRYGTGGIENVADAALRGQRSSFDALLHRPQAGAAITTTIDLDLQQRLSSALHASDALTAVKGAAIALNWSTGEVLALTSAPSFDPNTLDADWERLRTDPDAPLVNRATQGLYQPGELLPWLVEMQHLMRDTRHRESSFISHLSSLQLNLPVPFDLPNEAVRLPASATYSETLGQGTLRLTPLRVAASLAVLVAGAPITPTLLAPSSNGASNDVASRASTIAPFTGYAQIAGKQFVGWHVRVDGDRVIVLALELPAREHPALQQAVAKLVHHP